MGDSGGAGADCLASCFGLCCICCTEGFENWCLFQRFGGRGDSTSTAGCCGKCCKGSFDNDDLADEIEARKQAQAAEQSQPTPKTNMQVPSSDLEQPADKPAPIRVDSEGDSRL
ncbi:hypothetical protein QCA50_013428 [Cerrena zonata]|uniref:Uncharacterized protein n=1 Tax=Cerrena zonata TaxID=2478898 RepID=A0AAW0G3F9_9APHY